MACCGDEPDTKKEGLVQQRRCRDVIFLLLFLAFWAGMFIICGIAVRQGDTRRIIYGVDSFGFTCGTVGTLFNASVDLTANKNLYYLNPLDLLSFANIPYAKSICLSGCPNNNSVCSSTSLPCREANQYRCPYYLFSDRSVNGKLTNMSDTSTIYFDQLLTMNRTTDPDAEAFLQDLSSSQLGWVTDWISQYGISPSSPTVDGRYYQLRSQVPGEGPCYPVWVPTSEVFHRCFPAIPPEWVGSVVEKVGDLATKIGDAAVSTFQEEFNSLGQKWTRYVGDISRGFLVIIVGGLVGSVILSLFWLLILRYLAGFMAWFTVLVVNVALIGFTLYCFSMAGLLGNNAFGEGVADAIPDEFNPIKLEQTTWKYVAIAAAIVAGIVLLVTLLMITRMRVAIACIKVASQAVGGMPSILVFPLLPFVFVVGLVIYWIAITALLYSSGELTPNCREPSSYQPFTFANFSTSLLTNATLAAFTPPPPPPPVEQSCYLNQTKDDQALQCGLDPDCYLSYDWNNQLKYAFIYHFFGLLWTSQFLIGIAYVTIAGAIASFYWARGDPSQMPTFPVLSSLKNALVYHMGSVALGSFIIAIIQFIRFLLEYLDRKTKELQASNVIAQWAMCCIKFFMWLLEKIVAFINRNAYIMVAVKGTSYCTSAGRAVSLIVSNVLRIVAVNFIGDILIFLGKVAVAAVSGLIAFGMCELPYYTDPVKYPDTFLSSPALPVALSIIIGYFVASIFFSVYEMAIDTIILSFCEDCDVNGGNPRYAPALLMEVMGGEPKAQAQGGNAHIQPISK